MIRTWKVRGLVLLTAVPLLGAVPAAAGAEKPPPRPRTHAKPKSQDAKPKDAKPKDAKPKDSKPKDAKPEPKHAKPKAKHAKPRGKHAVKGAVLRMAAPQKDVIPGRTYKWTWTFQVSGKAKPHKAVFRTTLPKTLAFVSGEKHCTSSGRKVVCRLGTVKPGRKVGGVLRAKVAKRARPGQKIGPRGTVTWGGKRVTRRFPAVRVATTADLAITKTAPARARAAGTGRANNGAVARTRITGRR